MGKTVKLQKWVSQESYITAPYSHKRRKSAMMVFVPQIGPRYVFSRCLNVCSVTLTRCCLAVLLANCSKLTVHCTHNSAVPQNPQMIMMMSRFIERVITRPQTRCQSTKQVGLRMLSERRGGGVAVRKAAGKLFQMTGPATAKLVPDVVLVLGTNSNPVTADRIGVACRQ